jgi:AGZA family xanthine/uracil permease-like MFS transporter
VGVGQLAGFIDRDGRFPGSERAFVADAVGTVAGALFGTSTVTTYIESATGVEEGGRTGLTAVVTAGYFLLALAFAPLLVGVPTVATSPALVVVGALMMRGAAEIEWARMEEGLPAFLTVSMMALSYSIAHGIALGILSWVALRLLTGRFREVGWVPGGLAFLLVVYYALLGPL